MGVKFTPKFNQNDVRNFIRKRVDDLDKIILGQIKDVAEEFVRDARSVNTYTDQTNNLRSSIGYVILKDGRKIFGNFDGKKQEGISKAKELAEEIIAEYPRGYALIVVAGMNYALFVEANSFDVLTGSSQTAASNLKEKFDRIKRQLSKLK